MHFIPQLIFRPINGQIRSLPIDMPGAEEVLIHFVYRPFLAHQLLMPGSVPSITTLLVHELLRRLLRLIRVERILQIPGLHPQHLKVPQSHFGRAVLVVYFQLGAQELLVHVQLLGSFGEGVGAFDLVDAFFEAAGLAVDRVRVDVEDVAVDEDLGVRALPSWGTGSLCPATC